MLYIVTGTYYRYLAILKRLDLKDLPVKYANGVHTLTEATNEDSYFVSGLVIDRKDYQAILDKIQEIGLSLWEEP
jgi:hypothetical protein